MPLEGFHFSRGRYRGDTFNQKHVGRQNSGQQRMVSENKIPAQMFLFLNVKMWQEGLLPLHYQVIKSTASENQPIYYFIHTRWKGVMCENTAQSCNLILCSLKLALN